MASFDATVNTWVDRAGRRRALTDPRSSAEIASVQDELAWEAAFGDDAAGPNALRAFVLGLSSLAPYAIMVDFIAASAVAAVSQWRVSKSSTATVVFTGTAGTSVASVGRLSSGLPSFITFYDQDAGAIALASGTPTIIGKFLAPVSGMGTWEPPGGTVLRPGEQLDLLSITNLAGAGMAGYVRFRAIL